MCIFFLRLTQKQPSKNKTFYGNIGFLFSFSNIFPIPGQCCFSKLFRGNKRVTWNGLISQFKGLERVCEKVDKNKTETKKFFGLRSVKEGGGGGSVFIMWISHTQDIGKWVSFWPNSNWNQSIYIYVIYIFIIFIIFIRFSTFNLFMFTVYWSYFFHLKPLKPVVKRFFKNFWKKLTILNKM